MSARTRRPLSLVEAVLPLLTMLGLFVLGATFLDLGTELLVALMLVAAAVAGVIARRHGHTWEDIQNSTGKKLADVLPAVLILLAIGMLIGTWVGSGTIPFLVYWGVRLVSPTYLVLTAFLATAIMSLCTGTSWGSAGTIGVALMGTAAALDAPLGATAGAVVSGAYFGDKMSPLSDSTNISAIGAGAPLYTHIRHMLYTALPSFVVAVVVYTLAARLIPVSAEGLPDRARVLLREITTAFSLHWVVSIPPAIVVASIVRKVPAALAMATSSLAAITIAVLVQGLSLKDGVSSAVAGFRTTMLAGDGAWTESFTTLVERGGLQSMSNTLVVIIAAFLLAGAMDVSGSLDLMINRLLANVRSVFGLVAATMTAGSAMIALTSHGGVSSLVVGGLFQKAYRDRDMAPENLSRSLEDSVTIVEPLMPWTVSAVFMAGTLGVATSSYAPWAVFCYGGPLFSLLLSATFTKTGFGLSRTRNGDKRNKS